MKLFVFAAVCVVAASAARLENNYLPPNSAKTAGGSGSFLNAPRPGASFAAQAHAAPAQSYSGPTSAPIGIIRLNNDNNGDGTYQFDFETENRITAQESGQVKNAPEGEGAAVQGSFSYVGDDGQTYSINYVADENGFRPEGAHLPVAPAIPEEIQKALAQNAADEAAGINDDGQYRAEHQGPAGGQGQGGYSGSSGAGASRQYLAPKPSSSQQGGYRY